MQAYVNPARAALHSQVDALVDAFLAKGNQITVVRQDGTTFKRVRKPAPPSPWAIQWTNTLSGETTLCEVESNVVYEVGSRLCMALRANVGNVESRKGGFSSRYRAVPLPYAGPMP